MIRVDRSNQIISDKSESERRLRPLTRLHMQTRTTGRKRRRKRGRGVNDDATGQGKIRIRSRRGGGTWGGQPKGVTHG